MKKFLLSIFLAASVFLTGCATSDYGKYAEAQIAVATAKANAEAEKYKAFATVASQGDATAKVAVAMALAFDGKGSASQSQVVSMQAPKTAGDSILAWTTALLNPLATMYAVNRNAAVSMQASSDSAAIHASTIAGLASVAGKIQAPAANVTNTSVVRDSGNTTTTVNRTNTTVTRDSNNTTKSEDNRVTTTTTTTNTNNNSNNRTDNTSTPTVVTQPTPVVVTTTAPAASAAGN